jgi:hypothetical protein
MASTTPLTISRAASSRCSAIAPKRLPFADAERRLLAEKGKPLGRKLLAEIASLATPETILRWYREQAAAKYGESYPRPSGPSSRPR